MDPAPFDAIVLADGPAAARTVVGLTVAERARRVAVRAGARRVLVVDGAATRAGLATWWQSAPGLLVIRATDQAVHTPLVLPLVARGGTAIAVAPEVPHVGDALDLAPLDYAGALFASGADVDATIAALAAGDDDRVIADRLADAGAAAVPHGPIARHPAVTPADRKGAARLLYRMVHKPQDNAITRYLYRPVSFPLTRMFVHTPITPNQISILVGVIAAIGIALTARAGLGSCILGTFLVLLASYVDCCDGEVSRLKLLSSRIGAWLDTIIDEASSFGYMVALGWHCHLRFGPHYLGDLGVDPWLAAIAIGCVTYAIAIYAIYYNIIVVVGSANSQDYVGRFEVIAGEQPNTVRLRPAAAQAIDASKMSPALAFVATYLPYVVRRDFLSWASLGFAAVGLEQIMFGFLIVGGVITAVIVALDHVRLRRQRRAIAQAGQVLLVR